MKKWIFRLIISLIIFGNSIVIAQWKQLDGPYGGQYISMIETKGDTIVAVCGSSSYRTDGLYVSTNNGLNWREAGFKEQKIKNINFLKNSLIVLSEGEIYKSNDYSNWTNLNITESRITAMVVKGDTIIISDEDNMFYSIDAGLNWTKININMAQYYYVKNVDFEGNRIYINTYYGFYMSEDFGINWEKVVNDYYIIDSFIIDRNLIIFHDSSQSKTLISNDIGNSWIECPIASSKFYIREDSIFIAGNKLFLSTDEGMSWELIDSTLTATSFAVSKSNFWMGTGRGLYYSSDKGVNWVESNNGLNYPVIQSLAISDDNIIYAGTSDGLYISDNDGISWNKLFDNLRITNLAVFEGYIFVSTEKGVQFSTDKGLTWNNTDLYSFNTMAVSGNHFYAGKSDGGLYISVDDGSSWSLEYTFPYGDLYSLGIFGDSLFVGSEYGLYLSTDNGANFNNVLEFSGNYSNDDDIYHIEKSDGNIFVCGSNNLFISSSKNPDWYKMPLNADRQTQLKVIENVLFIGDNGGLKAISKNYPDLASCGLDELDILSISSTNNSLMVGTEKNGIWINKLPIEIVRNYITNSTSSLKMSFFDNGAIGKSNYKGVGLRFNDYPNVLANGSIVLALKESQYKNTINTSNEIQNLEPFIDVSLNSDSDEHFITKFRSIPLGVEVTQKSVSDDEDNFVIISYRIKNVIDKNINGLFAGIILDLDIGTPNENRCGFDLSRSLIYQYESEHKLDPNFYGIVALSDLSAFDVSYGNGEYLYNDAFEIMSQNQMEWYSTENHNYHFYVGTGPHFLEINDSVDVGFAIVAGKNLDDLVYSADLAQTKWDAKIEHNDDVENISFNLSQNYPNPFNSLTNIEYSITENEFVKLSVYDILGREVIKLVNEYQVAGNYFVEFDASTSSATGHDLSSGIYFYRLIADDFIETKKMILLR